MWRVTTNNADAPLCPLRGDKGRNKDTVTHTPPFIGGHPHVGPTCWSSGMWKPHKSYQPNFQLSTRKHRNHVFWLKVKSEVDNFLGVSTCHSTNMSSTCGQGLGWYNPDTGSLTGSHVAHMSWFWHVKTRKKLWRTFSTFNQKTWFLCFLVESQK